MEKLVDSLDAIMNSFVHRNVTYEKYLYALAHKYEYMIALVSIDDLQWRIGSYGRGSFDKIIILDNFWKYTFHLLNICQNNCSCFPLRFFIIAHFLCEILQ